MPDPSPLSLPYEVQIGAVTVVIQNHTADRPPQSPTTPPEAPSNG